jgi:predicted ferric reductase
MKKENIGNIVMMALVVTNIALWIIFAPANDGSRAHFTRQLVAEVIASTAVVFLSCALFLSTRLRSLETYFGGLDQMYQSHKRAGMVAIFLLFAHLFTVPLNASQKKPGTPPGNHCLSGTPDTGAVDHRATHPRDWSFHSLCLRQVAAQS